MEAGGGMHASATQKQGREIESKRKRGPRDQEGLPLEGQAVSAGVRGQLRSGSWAQPSGQSGVVQWRPVLDCEVNVKLGNKMPFPPGR